MPALDLSQPVDLSSIHSPIIIAGITVIALIFCATFSWLAFRIYQKHALAKRQSEMGAAGPSNGSRNRARALMSTNNSEKPPPPFMIAPAPVHFDPSTRPRHIDFNVLGPSDIPQSRISLISTLRQSRISLTSIYSTSTIGKTSGTRKVRQKFEPILPDELLPILGERLTVVQSFDDGWCVVGRENSTFVHTAKSLFKSPEPGQNTELGVIPAWCFIKPTKGIQAERPIRSSSLDITVDMNGPASRMDLMSWSKF